MKKINMMNQVLEKSANDAARVIQRNSPKVIVLLSTYNGEKYLSEQLDSLFTQVGVEIFCLVRDDGSSDKTLLILNEYKKTHKKQFDFYPQENKGVVQSFSELVKKALELDYEWIAFCDQDDIWKKNKLVRAISLLQQEKNMDIPLVYCSNLEVVDSTLTPISIMRNTRPEFNKYTAVVQNCSTGCTQVFNRKAAIKYCECREIGRIEMHDYWMFLIGVYLGKVIYDEWPSIYYRQHRNNVVGSRKKTLKMATKNIIQGKKGYREKMIETFINTYYSELSEEQKSTLENIVNYRNDLKAKLKLLLNSDYRGYNNNVTLNFKIRVFLNLLY